MDERVDEWMDEQVDEWVDERVDEWMDGIYFCCLWMDKWMPVELTTNGVSS